MLQDDGYGYGSFGQAGNRHAVESRPLFTSAQDPAEAFPMRVQVIKQQLYSKLILISIKMSYVALFPQYC